MKKVLLFLSVLACCFSPAISQSEEKDYTSNSFKIENTPLLTDDDLIGLTQEQMLQTIETRLLKQAEKEDDLFHLPHKDCDATPFSCSGSCVEIYPLFPQWWPAHKGKCNKRSGSCGRTIFLGCDCFFDTYETIPCPKGVLEGSS